MEQLEVVPVQGRRSGVEQPTQREDDVPQPGPSRLRLAGLLDREEARGHREEGATGRQLVERVRQRRTDQRVSRHDVGRRRVEADP